MDENIIDEFKVSSENAEECFESTISCIVVVKMRVVPSPKVTGWSKRRRSTEMRMRITSRSTRPRKVWRKYRVTVCNTLTEGNPLRSWRAVTDTDEDMVHILVTDDSHVTRH